MEHDKVFHERVPYIEPSYPFRMNCGNPLASNHWHNELELIYIMSGMLQLHINGTEYCGKENDIFIVNKNEIHGISRATPDVEFYVFVFDMNMLLFSMADICQKQFLQPLIDGNIRFFNKPESTYPMRAVFNRVFSYNTEKQPGYMLATKAALLEFFTLLFGNGQYSTEPIEQRDEMRIALVKRISLYINNHIGEKIALEEISAHFNMAPKYFCRFFKKNFKMTLIEYVNCKKVEQAATMIQQGQESITEIAISCGFSNTSYFTRIFKKVTGHTPSQYKFMNNNSSDFML